MDREHNWLAMFVLLFAGFALVILSMLWLGFRIVTWNPYR